MNWSPTGIQSTSEQNSCSIVHTDEMLYVKKQEKWEKYSLNEDFGEYEIYELDGKYEFKRLGNTKPVSVDDILKNLGVNL